MEIKNLEELSRSATSTLELSSLGKQARKLPKKQLEDNGFLTRKMALFRGYTVDGIIDVLQGLLIKEKIFLDVLDIGFGSYEQAILAKDPELQDYQPHFAYFCVGSDHLAFENLDFELGRWPSLWEQTHQLLHCEIIQNTFEQPSIRPAGNLEIKLSSSSTNFIQKLNTALSQTAPQHVHFNDVDFLASYHGRRAWRDPRLYDLSKVPVAYEFWLPYAQNLASLVLGLLGRAKKCVVLDLDNTLWGGVVGDDGVGHIHVGNDGGKGESFTRFQSYLKSLKERGILLSVCSKNEEHIAKEVFTSRREMVLKLNDISCFVANWEDKASNIKKIAGLLNIGLDSLVFVDDNPAERHLVKTHLPEVTVVDLPEDPSEFVRTLNESGLFEVPTITDEDLKRTEFYLAEQNRQQLQVSTSNYSDYLKSLHMIASIHPFDSHHLGRITQLINKTNQFNVTTRRYTEAEVESLSRNSSVMTRYVTLKDRFGDHGLISVLIAKTNEDQMEIDTWLMSCRVLKRDVEKLIFQHLLKEAINQKISSIKGVFRPTAKNSIVQNLFGDLGFKKDLTNPNGETLWSFDLHRQDRVHDTLNSPLPFDFHGLESNLQDTR